MWPCKAPWTGVNLEMRTMKYILETPGEKRLEPDSKGDLKARGGSTFHRQWGATEFS